MELNFAKNALKRLIVLKPNYLFVTDVRVTQQSLKHLTKYLPLLSICINYISENLLISSNIRQQIKECPDHQKMVELICMEDKELLCSHCAIFGGHRDHELKTFEEFDGELKEKMNCIQEIATIK